MRMRTLGVLGLVALAGCGAAPVARQTAPTAPAARAAAGSFTRSAYQGFTYKLYLPPDFKRHEPLPLVVMLHGCGQGADEIAAVTGFNDLARRESFAVLYPEQATSHHPRKCWRWFDPPHQSRGSGEPAIVAGMVGEVGARHGIDKGRVYVAGLSAGGAMSAVMAATYPDVFVAGSSSSGLEYLASTTTETDAWGAMARGGPDPAPIAAKVVGAMGTLKLTLPMLVFHGAADPLVNPINSGQTALQFVTVNDLVLEALGQGSVAPQPKTEQGQVPAGRSYTHSTWSDTSGRALVEEYRVDGMSHAWSGGAPGHLFSDPKGPDAGAIAWRFFTTFRRELRQPPAVR